MGFYVYTVQSSGVQFWLSWWTFNTIIYDQPTFSPTTISPRSADLFISKVKAAYYLLYFTFTWKLYYFLLTLVGLQFLLNSAYIYIILILVNFYSDMPVYIFAVL
jgi:hypothetical protein